MIWAEFVSAICLLFLSAPGEHFKVLVSCQVSPLPGALSGAFPALPLHPCLVIRECVEMFFWSFLFFFFFLAASLAYGSSPGAKDQDPSHSCNLYHSCSHAGFLALCAPTPLKRQCQILNPLCHSGNSSLLFIVSP